MNDLAKLSEPSKFWTKLAAKNEDMLSFEGLHNFKRTVANNYFNWAVLSVRHGLFLPALLRWLRRPDTIPFRTTLTEMDMFRKQQSADRIPLSWLQRQIYRFYVGLAWSVMRQYDRMNLASRIDEPDVGNPFPTRLDGRSISQDLANSLIECNVICGLLDASRPLRIAEVGAGYGRLAHVFTKAVDCEYHIFDIEPARSVAHWYLQQVSDPSRIHMHPPEDIAGLPDQYFDIVLSISTLPEMSWEQVTIYLKEFQRLSRNIIFLKQWSAWTNPDDGITVGVSAYRFGPEWTNILNVTDPLNTKFFNAAWRRISG